MKGASKMYIHASVASIIIGSLNQSALLAGCLFAFWMIVIEAG